MAQVVKASLNTSLFENRTPNKMIETELQRIAKQKEVEAMEPVN
jgi:hypothetical protein